MQTTPPLTPLTHYIRIIDVQARMALRADASRYMLGYIWWILEPLLFVAVFYLVFGVILNSGKANFIVFLMCGKLPFVWFSKTVVQSANSIINNRGLIGKVHIPKIIFPLAVVQESLYKQSAVFAMLFSVLLYNDYSVTSAYLWLLPLVLVNYLMITACALVASYVVCLVRDFAMAIPLAMTFLLFASGIFWDVHDIGDPAKTDLVLALNPVAFILDCYRQILMYSQPPDAVHLGILGLVMGVVIVVMSWLMARSSQYLAMKALTS